MIYKRVEPYTQEQAEKVFAHGTRAEIIDALLGVTYYVKDWRWVQNACLALLARPECGVQWSAIQCLGHLATFHRVLDFAVVLPAIQPHLSDPALAPVLYDALSDMVGVEDASYFEQYWETLPQRIRDVLIEEGIFNSLGKRVRKRNFLTARKNDATWQHSPDQETLERLKRQLKADSAYSWDEYYDEQGRLLRLNLSELELEQLPVDLWQLRSLQELDLSENQLGSLPSEIGQLKELESLALSQNKLSDLPAELGHLRDLQELYLDLNHFSTLPDVLWQLTSLQMLSLSENQLRSLPVEVGRLVNLLWMSVDKNQLNSLPVELGQLVNVRTLFLGQNQLRSLPAELAQLRHLQWLDLEENQLSSLPAELGQLQDLDRLYLSKNPHLQVPPPDIVQKGAAAILAHLRMLP